MAQNQNVTVQTNWQTKNQLTLNRSKNDGIFTNYVFLIAFISMAPNDDKNFWFKWQSTFRDLILLTIN